MSIKRCPFCGASGKLFSHEMSERKTIWWVQCTNSHCMARITPKSTDKSAIEAWNERR